MKKNKKLLIGGLIALVVILGCGGYYFLEKNNTDLPGSSISKKIFTESTMNDFQILNLEYDNKEVDPLEYLKNKNSEVNVSPKTVSLTTVGDTEVTYKFKDTEVKCEFVVNDTKAPVITLVADTVDIDSLEGYDMISNIQAVEDPIDGALPKVEAEPEKFSSSYDGRIYETGWYTVTLNDSTVTVHASDTHGNISEKTFTLNVSEQPSTDEVQMYSYQPVDLEGLEDPSNWALIDSSDWYYAACTYHSQQYQTPHEALQDVVNHEVERGNTVNVENETRIFCVKDGSGNVLYYEAGFED